MHEKPLNAQSCFTCGFQGVVLFRPSWKYSTLCFFVMSMRFLSFFSLSLFFSSRKCIIFGFQIKKSVFTMEVAALLADLRSCLRCDTSPGTAPLGAPHLGLQHVCKSTWGFVFWFGFSGTGIWNPCYWSPPVRSSGGGFLTSHPFHNNIHLHTSILSCHIVGLISGNVVSKIKDLFPFWKFSVDLCHLNR